jgi:hypothetical protein
MSLRNKFLAYVEYQRSAEQLQTVAAFEKANQAKREVLMRIEELEGMLDPDPDNRDWYYDGDGTKRLKDK